VAALSEECSAANANLYVLLRACDRWVDCCLRPQVLVCACGPVCAMNVGWHMCMCIHP
jgi:hypothetical protein